MKYTKKGNNHKKNKTQKRIKNICSPYAKEKKTIDNSCFSNDILLELKKYYNENNRKKITSNNPKVVWRQLHSYLSDKTCNHELCWLNKLHINDHEKMKLKTLFLPIQPDEWKKDKNAWLSDEDIVNVLHQYEYIYPTFLFFEPSPIDFDYKKDNVCVDTSVCDFNIAKYPRKKKFGFVFNLSKHNQIGTHWVALYVSVTDSFIYYFDSNGDKIPKEVKSLVERIQTQGLSQNIKFIFHQNNKIEHQRSNTECGMYVLYFIITMLTRKTSSGKKLTKKTVIDYFNGKLSGRIKDSVVEDLRTKYFIE